MMLEVTDLSKSFSGKQVLSHFNLSVDKGEVISIIGPSGAGKTTALRCINFLERADSGTFLFDGEQFDFAHVSKKDIARLHFKTGFVFQNFNLFLNKTALQNVTEGLIIARHMKKEEAIERAKQVLNKVGLSQKYDAFPQELSGGQQQRVAIARSLATEPEIIYFDEPTSALDPVLTGEVLEVMKTLASEGMTMIVVTHELNFARTVSNKVIFMEDGRIIESGNAAAVFENPQQVGTQKFLQSVSGNK
jgi:cystine transport system ATP-binding protein/L-cystine transport system ATP-binding protein